MKMKRTKSISIEELWEYEAQHPVVFASPRALADARRIAELDRIKRASRRTRTQAAVHRTPGRKLTTA